MIKLKPITETSWLIFDEFKSVGLLSKNPNESFFMLFGDQKTTFENENVMRDFFKFDIFENIITKVREENKENFVKGFPVDYPEIYEVTTNETDLPLYTKSEKSEVWYAAGYYCINFTNGGWLQSSCPKYKTLKKYGYVGPFNTEIEMRAKLSALKKESNDKT